MKKRIFVFILAVLTVLAVCAQTTSAAVVSKTEIVPRWGNTTECRTGFNITTSGIGHVYVSYTGNSNFSYTKVTVEIQKRFLGLFWKTVEIGYTDDQWIGYCYDMVGSVSNSFALEDTGTYRANFTIEIIGNDGSVDTIEDQIECKYS